MLAEDRHDGHREDERAEEISGHDPVIDRQDDGHGHRNDADIVREHADQQCHAQQDQERFRAVGQREPAETGQPPSAPKAQPDREHMPEQRGHARERPGKGQLRKERRAEPPGRRGLEDVQQRHREPRKLAGHDDRVGGAGVAGAALPHVIAAELPDHERGAEAAEQIAQQEAGGDFHNQGHGIIPFRELNAETVPRRTHYWREPARPPRL